MNEINSRTKQFPVSNIYRESTEKVKIHGGTSNMRITKVFDKETQYTQTSSATYHIEIRFPSSITQDKN